MKFSIFAPLLVLAVTLSGIGLGLSAFSAPYHGNFIICANRDDTIKMTADLSDGKGEKVATAVQNGIKLFFPEVSGRKPRYDFQFYPNKQTPLIMTQRGQREPEVALTVGPAPVEPEVLHDRKTPLIYRMIRFKGILTLKTFKIFDQDVTCTESKWESD
jgi:hypothetical protein